MKNFLLLLLVSICANNFVNAQKSDSASTPDKADFSRQTVYLELAGNGFSYSLNYDY